MHQILVDSLTKTFPLSRKQRRQEHFARRGKKALDGLSFSVESGEVFGLLGPNGAGKTTAMRIIAALVKSDSGDVRIADFSVREHPLDVKRNIGFLSGDLRLEEFFTPAYLFDFFAALHEALKPLAKKRREELFEKFEMNSYAHQRIATLSSGMKQKAALVVSIAHDPPVIIFDEPTNGLDLLAAKTFTDFILELKAQGKTIILSTHIFSLAEKVCDRIGFIMDGKLLACGTKMEIAGSGGLEAAFFKLYNEHNRVETIEV